MKAASARCYDRAVRRFGATLLATLALLGSSTAFAIACACAPTSMSAHCCCARRQAAARDDAPALKRAPCCEAGVVVRDAPASMHEELSPRVAPAPFVAALAFVSHAITLRDAPSSVTTPARAPPIALGPPLYLRVSSIRC